MPVWRDSSRERRWIVLGIDGRYVTLGRATDPLEETVREAEKALRAQGLAGWLAIMEGNPYVGTMPELMEVRPLADPSVPFKEASAACIRAIAEQRGAAAS